MIKGRFAVFVLGIAVVCLMSTATVSATPVTIPFTVDTTTGPLAGNTYVGSFTYDPSVSHFVTAFTFDYPSWTGSVSDFLFTPSVTVPLGLEAFYNPGPTDASFAFFGSSPLFTYGTFLDPNTFVNSGEGTVVYGTAVTPEPSTLLLLGTGLACAWRASRRKRAA